MKKIQADVVVLGGGTAGMGDSAMPDFIQTMFT